MGMCETEPNLGVFRQHTKKVFKKWVPPIILHLVKRFSQLNDNAEM